MGTRDPRIDAYIENAPDFAKPILTHLRDLVHAGCPNVQETMKWSVPHFDYNGIMCTMACFKEHCAFGFWKAALILGEETGDQAAGNFGRIKKVSDLPSKRIMIGYIKEACRLNEEGVKAPMRRKSAEPKELVVPPWFTAALKKNRAAQKEFDAFSPSHRREYVEWLEDAKTDATREKRLATALEWIAEGKSRHWKYARK